MWHGGEIVLSFCDWRGCERRNEAKTVPPQLYLKESKPSTHCC